jgi:hypothetical protein
LVLTMTLPDEHQPVVYGSPPRSLYYGEMQNAIGEELKAGYAVPRELPYRLLVVLMQLKELDRKEALQPGQKAPSRGRRKPGGRAISRSPLHE